MESILSMSAKVFGMLNREDHDELLFTLLEKSGVQAVETGNPLTNWDEVNLNFTAENIADIYLVALECLKLSILPVTAGLKILVWTQRQRCREPCGNCSAPC